MKQTTRPHQMISSKKPTILKAFPAISIKATRQLGTKNLTFDVILSTSDVTSHLLSQQQQQPIQEEVVFSWALGLPPIAKSTISFMFKIEHKKTTDTWRISQKTK